MANYTQDPNNPNASIPVGENLLNEMVSNVPNPNPIATPKAYDTMVWNLAANNAQQNNGQGISVPMTDSEKRSAVLRRLIELKGSNVENKIGIGTNELTGAGGVVSSSDKLREAENIDKQNKMKETASSLAEKDAELAKLSKDSQIKQFKESLGITEPTPKTTTLSSDYESLRSERGVSQLESAINDINTQIANAELAAKNEALDISKEYGASAGRRSDRKQIASERAQNAISALNLKKQVMLDELNTKNSVITTLMNLKREDYQNALNNYNTKFNQAIQLNSAFSSYKDKQDAIDNRVRDDARANINLVINSIKGTGRNYDSLDEGTRSSIIKLATQSGIDSKILKEVINNEGVSQIISTQSGYDDNGNQTISFIVKDKNGMPKVLNSVTTQATKKGAGETGASAKFKSSATGKEYDLSTVSGITDYVKDTGATYDDIRSYLDRNVPSLTSTTINQLLKAAGENVFLTKDYLREMFGDQLSSLAKDKKGTGFFGFGKEKESEDEVLNRIMNEIDSLRKGGLSDAQILKQKQSSGW